MPVHSKKAYERKKAKKRSSPIPNSGKGSAGKPAPAPVSKVVPSGFLHVLQDPESRTFSDSIILGGRKVKRDCIHGLIKTKDTELADFLVSKGWMLLDKQEAQNGKIES